MKIKVSPRSLAEQLPELRLDILQIYETEIILEGFPHDQPMPIRKSIPEQYTEIMIKVLKEHPEFEPVFTKKELLYMFEFFDREIVQRDVLEKFHSGASNCVDVTIKNIRKKLTEYKLPWKITNIHRAGMYKMEPVDN